MFTHCDITEFKTYFLRPEKIGAKQKIVFTASQIWEMACAK